MNINKCRLCDLEFNRLSNHVRRTHLIEYRDYLIQHEHGGTVPSCSCGCGGEAPYTRSQGEGFKRFIHGHHARVRVRSDDERRKIGEKNSVNMKMYAQEHLQEMAARVEVMETGRTEESEKIRIEKLIQYNRSEIGRRKKSEQSKRLWSSQRPMMLEASQRGGQTARIGFASGRLHRTEEQRDRISRSIVRRYQEGGFRWSRGKYRSTKMGCESHYRSSWELRHMHDLDSDANVASWQYEPHVIYYEWEGSTHRYLPDFIVTFSDGRRELQEVGVGALKGGTPRNIAKAQAAREWCQTNGMSFRVVSFG